MLPVQGANPWSGNEIPHAVAKSSRAAAKTWCRQITKKKKKERKQTEKTKQKQQQHQTMSLMPMLMSLAQNDFRTSGSYNQLPTCHLNLIISQASHTRHGQNGCLGFSAHSIAAPSPADLFH